MRSMRTGGDEDRCPLGTCRSPRRSPARGLARGSCVRRCRHPKRLGHEGIQDTLHGLKLNALALVAGSRVVLQHRQASAGIAGGSDRRIVLDDHEVIQLQDTDRDQCPVAVMAPVCLASGRQAHARRGRTGQTYCPSEPDGLGDRADAVPVALTRCTMRSRAAAELHLHASRCRNLQSILRPCAHRTAAAISAGGRRSGSRVPRAHERGRYHGATSPRSRQTMPGNLETPLGAS